MSANLYFESSVPAAVRAAITRGERNEEKLTNQVFFSRHPEHQGKRIASNEPRLADEWRRIRDTIVRPALVQTTANVPQFLGIDYGSVDENTNPDWTRAKNEGGVRFAIIRAVWDIVPDRQFKRDWPKVRDAGIVRGAYLFLRFPNSKYPAKANPVAQANALIKTVGRLEKSDLPPSLDVEFPGKGRTETGMTAQQCLDGVRAASKVLADYYGVPPIIYTSARVWHEDLNDLPASDLIESPLWLAKYPFKKGPARRDIQVLASGRFDPPVPPPWGDATNWWIHQYQGDASSFPGFRQVDLNRFNVMMPGVAGDRVKWVQRRLGILVNGNFDTAMEAAVKTFQQKQGLTATAVIDPRTFTFLCWSNPASRQEHEEKELASEGGPQPESEFFHDAQEPGMHRQSGRWVRHDGKIVVLGARQRMTPMSRRFSQNRPRRSGFLAQDAHGPLTPQFEAPYIEHELETPHPKDDPRLLAFKIPEAPYSDSGMQLLHRSVDAIESVHTALEIFAPEVAGLVGVAVSALASMVAPILPIAAAYAEARADVSRNNLKQGFRWGVVAGANQGKWPFVKDLFWMWSPGSGADRDLAVVGQNAHNLGLVAGFLQGREVARNPKKKEFFWRSIGRTLTEADLAQYGGDSTRWSRREWIDWYIRAGVSFEKLYVKD